MGGGGQGGLSCLPKGTFILVRSGVIFYCFYFARIRIRNEALIYHNIKQMNETKLE